MAPRTASLAELVRARRERLHLTQDQLAREVGVSRSAISEIEAGRIHHPRAGVFARLASVLGVPAAALLAAVGFAAGDLAGTPAALQLEEAEELLVLGALLSQMSAGERRWLQERLRELQQLVALRTGRPRRSGPRGRGGRRTRGA